MDISNVAKSTVPASESAKWDLCMKWRSSCPGLPWRAAGFDPGRCPLRRIRNPMTPRRVSLRLAAGVNRGSHAARPLEMLGRATRSLPGVSRAAGVGRSADPRHQLPHDELEPTATAACFVLASTRRCADRIRSPVPVGPRVELAPARHRPAPTAADHGPAPGEGAMWARPDARGSRARSAPR